LIEPQMDKEQIVKTLNRYIVKSAKPSNGEPGLTIQLFNHSTIHASACPFSVNRQ